MQSKIFKINKILFLCFLIVLFFFLFPITYTIEENNGQIKMFSSGHTSILYFNELTSNFNFDHFFFYKKIIYTDIGILNITNSPIKIQKGENLIQKQMSNSSAMVFYRDSTNLFNFENYYYNTTWLEDSIKLVDYFLNNIRSIDGNEYILYLGTNRSFQILPNVYIVNSLKDLAHELSHYFFGYQVKPDNDSYWHELLSEVNSVLFLRSISKYRYLNELELKTIGFYYEPYGKKVIEFLEYFNYDQEKIFELERYILSNYKSLNDEEFKNIISNFRFN